VQRFRDGLVFKAHRLVYHSTLGLREIKKKEEEFIEKGFQFKIFDAIKFTTRML